MHGKVGADKGGVDELTKEFLAESGEGLDRMDRCLTALEATPDDAELLGEIFRAVHTIKGTTGFLGFARLEKLAHAGENLLGALRDGKLTANGVVISGLLQLMDGLRAILRLIEATGREGDRKNDDDAEVIALMGRLLRQEGAAIEVKARQERVEAESAGVTAASGVSDRTLRIDVDVLNRMVNLVGELVLTRNQILQTAGSVKKQGSEENFTELARRLDAVTADLRETVMQARMQPVGHLFGKFPRMVRDLSKSCGKQVRIEFSGQDTGLDKSLLEAIKDPLTHALRNCVDHGIEQAADRLMIGKPAEGTVWMRARQQNGYVVVEIEDDGRGVSRVRVLEKAVAQGLITAERGAAMSDREMQQIVFMPGFSTAAAVTKVSGRGVGMDVVRANVEQVGGTIEIDSVEGRGTVVRMKVPLTLAIVPALVVQSGGQSFCLPQNALMELVCVMNHEAATAVERIGGVQLYRLRDTMLPMIWLDGLLGLEGNRDELCARGFYLAVLEADGCRFGLVVDEVLAPEEIVVKPVSAEVRDIGMFSGATVLGNGMLAMILDVTATAMRAGVHVAQSAIAAVEPVKVERSVPSFLVFDEGGCDGLAERMALPLSAVERIETIRRDAVERVGGRLMLQYRGELLALEDAGGELRGGGTDDDCVTVLICRKQVHRTGPQRVGLVVRRVLDVADGQMLDGAAVCAERLAMVQERVTLIRESFGGLEGLREVA